MSDDRRPAAIGTGRCRMAVRMAMLGLLAAGSVLADNIGVFDFTELPDEGYSATATLFNTNLTVSLYFPRPEPQVQTSRGLSGWAAGIAGTLIGGGGGPCTDGTGGPCFSTKAIIFQEPDDAGLYNIFEMAPQGGTDSTNFLWYSDVPDPVSLTWGDCTDPVTYNIIACPFVADGSTVELPTWGSQLGGPTRNLGTITIRFTDEATATTSPEPGSTLLIGSGLALIGLGLRARKTKALSQG